MPWLGFNLAETTSAQPPWGRGHAQQKPNSVKSPTVEGECKENPVQRKWQEAQHAGKRDNKNKLGRKLTRLSLREPPVKVGGLRSYGWKDIQLTKSQFLYNLSFLVSLIPQWIDEQQWVHLRDFGRGYLVAIVQGGGGSSVLNLLVPRIRPMKTVSTGWVFSRFSSRGLWRGFLSMFFPLLFPPILHLLFPSMPLLTNYWAGHHLSISESCAWNHYLQKGLKPTWQRLCAMLSHSVISNWDLSLAITHSAWF